MIQKIFFTLTAFLVFIELFAQPNFALVGYATQNGGTTGGQGGTTVTASTLADFKKYAESADKYIIMVNGTIANGTSGAKINIKSNKSIIGDGSTAFLSGIGLEISTGSNVIIQNIKMSFIGLSNPSGINGGDMISIHTSAKNIWIDHCEFYSENPNTQTDLDKYDGMLDIKGNAGYITISWCYFHDHWKCGLVGAADDDLYSERLITYHHNYYKNVKYRMPMFRGATGHFFNNYLYDVKDATELRAGTCVRVEKNYYEGFNYAIYSPTDSKGYAERIDNYLSKTQSRAFPGNCTANIPYNYSSVLTTNVQDVKTVVMQYAGVGKLTVSTNPTVSITTPAANQTYTAPATVSIAASALAGTGKTISKVEFYNGTIKLGEDATSPYTYSWTNVAAGTYSITAVATDNTGGKTTSTAVNIKVSAPKGPYGGTAHPIPGKIEFEQYDEGGNGVAYYDNTPGSAVTPVVNYRTTEDVDIETCTDTGTGYNIGYATAGEWLEYSVNVATAGTYTITLRAACDGDRTVSIQAKGVTIANNVTISSTGGWQVWQDVVIPNITLTAGAQVIRLTIGATNYVNLNYMTYALASTPAPTVVSPVTYCQGASSIALTATGVALKWYTLATGGSASTAAPIPSTANAGTTNYYVSQTINGIESSRASIIVTINATPLAPVVNSPKELTILSEASPLSATGTNLRWYTTVTGGTASTIAPTPSTASVGTTYFYVSQTPSLCESPRAAIAVVVSVPKVALKPGWNLIGCPISGSTDIDKALSSIWDKVEVVKNNDNFYYKSQPAIFNGLLKLEWGQGYYIKVNANCELIWNEQ